MKCNGACRTLIAGRRKGGRADKGGGEVYPGGSGNRTFLEADAGERDCIGTCRNRIWRNRRDRRAGRLDRDVHGGRCLVIRTKRSDRDSVGRDHGGRRVETTGCNGSESRTAASDPVDGPGHLRVRESGNLSQVLHRAAHADRGVTGANLNRLGLQC